MKSGPKVKLGKVISCLYLGLSTLIGPTIYQDLALCTYSYQHLALFTLILLNLPLIALI